MTKQMPFYPIKVYYITINQVFEVIIQQIFLPFLTDKILKGFDESLLTGMMLIDLQKAFDTIDHEILLQKLKAIKFSESTIKWFKSYLSERIFLVNIKNKLSDFGEISCGVTIGVDFRISVVLDLR